MNSLSTLALQIVVSIALAGLASSALYAFAAASTNGGSVV